MRYRPLLLCLILLSLTFACSNKSSDQPASSNTASAPATQPTTPEQSAPSATPTPATSEKPAHNPATSKKLANEAASSSNASKPTAAAPLVIPEGTTLSVRLQDSLSSATSHSGDNFSATLMHPITVDGKEIVPAQSEVRGTVSDAQAKGKIKGEARLKLVLNSITVRGQSYPIQTSMTGFAQQGKGKRTAVTTGGGAALGAIIGGIAGGGKGAAIGALVGGGAGLAGGTLTGNKQIELPAESALNFKLTQPVTLK